MSDIVERLRGRADRYRQLWGNAAYYTEGDALFDEKTADTITTLRADLQKLNERNAEYIGTIDRLRRRVAETDVEIERLRAVMKTAIRQFEDGNQLSCHRTLCDEMYGRQT